MMKTITEINEMDVTELRQAFHNCCGSSNWVNGMLQIRPFESIQSLLDLADDVWCQMENEDFLEAFSHHPKIGDKASLQKKFASTAHWAGNEQSGVDNANEAIIDALAEGNRKYEEKFGYIFIVCATGKSAEEMLQILNDRLENDVEDEIIFAAAEQAKITNLRLQKWINE